MKKLLIFLSFVSLIVVFALTCPNKQEHSESINNFLTDIVREKTDKDGVAGIVWGGLGSFIMEGFIKTHLSTDNYFIFSLGKISYQENNKIVSFGILNHVFILGEDKIKEALDSNNSENISNGNRTNSSPLKTQPKQNEFSSGIEMNTNRDKYPHNR